MSKMLVPVAVAAVALLAGVSHGDERTNVVEPMVIQLRVYGCATNDHDPATDCHVYRLIDEAGHRTGEISRFRTPIFDLDGNEVGREFRECVSSRGSGSICTTILTLRDSAHTERGRIVLTGVPDHVIPITGGSGAYQNAHGQGEAESDHGSWLVTLSLTP